MRHSRFNIVVQEANLSICIMKERVWKEVIYFDFIIDDYTVVWFSPTQESEELPKS